ncbi:hypothetical protein LOD99_15053 [Oopsacas minuta]|uniref:Uncharacterized protein n=1 Tax=Oopsacas minuta TaxID=111878 RepID=A0AAV7KDX9_9METZ|nr:hypothetical protein LOD99_15053 [Oopsacas minuta]
MLAEKYEAITIFFTQGVYPTAVLQSKIAYHAKKNFRVKASQYVIGEENKLFKVINSGSNSRSLEVVCSDQGFCIPDVIAYQVLKDCSPETMRREITYSLMEFSKHIYPDMGPTQAWDYLDKVLYALVMFLSHLYE